MSGWWYIRFSNTFVFLDVEPLMISTLYEWLDIWGQFWLCLTIFQDIVKITHVFRWIVFEIYTEMTSKETKPRVFLYNQVTSKCITFSVMFIKPHFFVREQFFVLKSICWESNIYGCFTDGYFFDGYFLWCFSLTNLIVKLGLFSWKPQEQEW